MSEEEFKKLKATKISKYRNEIKRLFPYFNSTKRRILVAKKGLSKWRDMTYKTYVNGEDS